MRVCVGFSDTQVFKTSDGVGSKDDMMEGGEGTREDVVYRDANTSIKKGKTRMRLK